MVIKTIKIKRGIAMIELIFALVIMGIVLLSAPMLIQQSIKSGNVALQQEAITAAATQTSIVLAMHWDEANSNIVAGQSPVLDTNRSFFNFTDATKPLGLVGVSGRNSKNFNVTVPPSLANRFGNNKDINETGFNDFDDVDDHHGSIVGLTVFNNENTTADVGDYIDVNLEINTTVNYAEDRPDANATSLNGTNISIGSVINIPVVVGVSNIKFINVNLTSDSGVDQLDKNITLQAFSCNIGTSLPEGETER